MIIKTLMHILLRASLGYHNRRARPVITTIETTLRRVSGIPGEPTYRYGNAFCTLYGCLIRPDHSVPRSSTRYTSGCRVSTRLGVTYTSTLVKAVSEMGLPRVTVRAETVEVQLLDDVKLCCDMAALSILFDRYQETNEVLLEPNRVWIIRSATWLYIGRVIESTAMGVTLAPGAWKVNYVTDEGSWLEDGQFRPDDEAFPVAGTTFISSLWIGPSEMPCQRFLDAMANWKRSPFGVTSDSSPVINGVALTEDTAAETAPTSGDVTGEQN